MGKLVPEGVMRSSSDCRLPDYKLVEAAAELDAPGGAIQSCASRFTGAASRSITRRPFDNAISMRPSDAAGSEAATAYPSPTRLGPGFMCATTRRSPIRTRRRRFSAIRGIVRTITPSVQLRGVFMDTNQGGLIIIHA